MLALAFVLTAHATEADCRRCCAEASLGSCTPALEIVGEETLLVESGGAWRGEGLWVLGCDGSAFWDDDAMGFFEVEPTVGEVNTADASKAFLKCFVETCGFAAGICPRAEAGRPVLKTCDDQALTDHLLDPSRPAAEPESFQPAAPAPSRPSVAQVTTEPDLQTGGLGTDPAPLVEPHAPQPAERHPAESRQAEPLGAGSPARSLPTSTTDKAAHITLPPAPIPPCDTGAAEASASRDQVDQGNEAEIGGDLQRAAGSYRAALTLDPCNVHAWVSIGQLANRQGQHNQAIKALDNALLLRPEHYGAAVALGQAYERMGRSQDAAEAYQQALDHRPGHPAAVAGLKRLGVAPR